MTYKTILVQVEARPPAESRLHLAIALAKAAGGAVVGVGALPMPMPVTPPFGYFDGATVQLLQDQFRKDLDDAEALFRRRMADTGIVGAWRWAQETPASAVVGYASAADLIVCTSRRGDTGATFADPGDLVMQVGSPVLVTPVEWAPAEFRSVLVAWKSARESRRALFDALPFLVAAERVTIAAIAQITDAIEAEMTDLVDRLRRHGVAADSDLSPQTEQPVETQLLAIAESRGADLIVAGAYGHSRLRQWVFGGVTQHLLTHTPVPVLFSR